MVFLLNLSTFPNPADNMLCQLVGILKSSIVQLQSDFLFTLPVLSLGSQPLTVCYEEHRSIVNEK